MSEKKMQQQSTPHGVRSDPNRIIAMKLRALYNSVEQEGIPDRFLALLERLDEAERRQSKANETDE
jgi:Anti-sigma factor NepR